VVSGFTSSIRALPIFHSEVSDTASIHWKKEVFIFLIMTLISPTLTSHAQSIGIKVGDWIKYSYSGQAPLGADWIKVQVTSIDASGQIHLRESYHLLNGTVSQDPRDYTFTVGQSRGNFSFAGGPVALPANSGKGFTSEVDLGYGYHPFVINEEENRNYAGKSFTVIGITDGYNYNDTTFTAYWDKPTGWLLQFSTYYKGGLWSGFEASETNIGNEVGPASGLTLSATSTTMRTDSTNLITIKAIVNSQDGSPVPDGTPVQFTIIPTSGELGGAKLTSETVDIAGGQAETTLMAPTQSFWSSHDPSQPDQNKIILGASSGDAVADPFTINITPMCTVNFQTDQPSYEQGMAVTLKGQVYYNGTETAPNDNQVTFDVTIPGAETWNSAINTTTGTFGNFTVMPFAGWNTGTYKVKLITALTIQNGDGGETRYNLRNQTSFQVVQATPLTDYTTQLDTLTTMYKATIPNGPIVSMRYLNTLGVVPKDMHGSYENMFIGYTADDPNGDFICGGYQTKVINFFDSIRFNKDPAIRELLRGLDYGPIQRGIPNNYSLGIGQSLTGHVAVILYRIGSTWNGLQSSHRGVGSTVFDPWITQTPEVYTLNNWVGKWGFPQPDETKVEMTGPTSAFSGYPITGGPICSNLNMRSKKSGGSTVTKTNLLGRCPVDMLVTDSQGRRVGMLPNGTMVLEFPAIAERYTDENNQTLGWYFGLGSDVYNVAITGQTSGEFQILVSSEATGGQAIDYGNQTITKGAQANLTLSADNTQPTMTLPDGSMVTPKPYRLPTTSNSTGGAKPNFVISDLTINPQQVNVGGQVNISANVTNTGQAVGTYNATLIVNNQAVGSKVVNLSPGQTTTVGWHTTSAWPEGSYDVEIGKQTGTFTITTESTPSGGSGSGSSNGIPGYPVGSVMIGMIIGMALLVYLSRRRRTS
jgi:hypothetical protein